MRFHAHAWKGNRDSIPMTKNRGGAGRPRLPSWGSSRSSRPILGSRLLCPQVGELGADGRARPGLPSHTCVRWIRRCR